MCGSLEKRGDGERQTDRERDRETWIQGSFRTPSEPSDQKGKNGLSANYYYKHTKLYKDAFSRTYTTFI